MLRTDWTATLSVPIGQQVFHCKRLALEQQESMNRSLGEPLDRWSDSTRHRIYSQVESLLKYLLFTEEAHLSEAVAGTSGFQEEFPKTGPRDHLGRSLRDFDLKPYHFPPL